MAEQHNLEGIPTYKEIMDLDEIYENVQSWTSTEPQTQNHNQDEEKDRKHRWRSRCVLVMMVSLGLICVLLLLFITLQYINITAERDLYKNTVEELNHTISSLQNNNTDLKTEKQQLKNDFSSLSLEKLELENRITSLSNELTEKTKQGNLCGPVVVFISSEAKSWSEGRQYCRNHGADLVIIKSEEKQKHISSLVKEKMWIGLSDIESEGNMKWVDHSPLNQRFWSRGEPNDAGGNEDCIELMPADPVLNNWNDLPCSASRKAICEK